MCLWTDRHEEPPCAVSREFMPVTTYVTRSITAAAADTTLPTTPVSTTRCDSYHD